MLTHLGKALAGAFTATATLGARTDGARLLYHGREHVVASEPEHGKTWFAVLICRQVLDDGGHVLYVDFEDDAAAVARRLLDAGADRKAILDQGRFRYVRPDRKPQDGEYERLLSFDGTPADLVILDGVTEAFALFGGEVNSQESASIFRKIFVTPATRAGAATLATDHIGARHKKAGLTGVLFELRNSDPFVPGGLGRSQLLINKDRSGDLRSRGVRQEASRAMEYGTLVLDARATTTDDGAQFELYLDPPAR